MKREPVPAGLEAIGGAQAAGASDAPLFDRILVANRGEIACRIMKTARRLGIGTVAVYSEADEGAAHVAMADDAICIGAGPARASYLDMARVLEACRQAGAQALHPGYGFLSESAEFARRVEMAGVTFIGPRHHSIAAMGDKIAAKLLAIEAGVDVIPGWNGAIESEAQAVALARDIGFPLMVKASAGGGGRGLRIACDESQLLPAIAACRSEALGSFGDERVFLERLVPRARHLEVQVLADGHGHCVHLWERECSIQRRHQKLIEEAPSPSIDAATRLRMCDQAVALARHAAYQSAGTVEFLVDPEGRFYFLEMNTRLQVEHGVTECVTGIDLVEQMIRIAAGERLSFSQADVPLRGCAIECRINADDPARGFLPSAGRLVRFQAPPTTMEAALPVPEAGGLRCDGGVREGDVISTHYDSLICKLISHAPDRERCVGLMREALDSLVIRGISTNQSFQAAMFADPRFQAGHFDTSFVADAYGSRFEPSLHPAEEGFLLALAVAVHVRALQRAASISGQMPGSDLGRAADFVVVSDSGSGGPRHLPVRVRPCGSVIVVSIEGNEYPIALRSAMRDIATCGDMGGVAFRALVERDGLNYALARNGSRLVARVMTPRVAELQRAMPERPLPAQDKALLSPMPGRLVQLAVTAGQCVRAGEKLAVVEAMKMENVLTAREDCVVGIVEASMGDSLSVDQVIMRFA
jgi:propionyl-CoA carboxylase alpha chain